MNGRTLTRIALPLLAVSAVVAGCSTTDAGQAAPSATAGATPAAATSPSTPSTSPATSAPVSAERAGRIATDRFGGRVLNVEPDTAAGRPSWEVEIAGSREGRIEVDVSQADGSIVEMERD